MLPSLPALQAFNAAAKSGSFRAAADKLCVTPTSISHHIRNLEDQLGLKLFHRTGRRVVLTGAGEKLFNATSEAFSLLEQSVAGLRRDARETVRIAAGPIFTARWLMPKISDFWERHPEIDLQIVPAYRPRLLGQDAAEITIRWERVSEMPDTALRLVDLRPVVVASPDYVERHGPFDRYEALLQAPILHQRNHWGWLDWFAAMGVEVDQPLRGVVLEDANILLRGAVEGQGAIIGWLPFVSQDLREGRVIRLFDEEIRSTHAYFMEVFGEDRASKAVKVVADWLASVREQRPSA
ncbi:MAG: LysR family transcriptional regulator [Rhodobacteraceae bacterium]|nr:LysR family transcriptional regulator [Paracoccaceae bacterium]